MTQLLKNKNKKNKGQQMLKTFKMGSGDDCAMVTIDTEDVAEIHFYHRKSFQLITKSGKVYEIIEVNKIHGDYKEMYECFLQAIENDKRYINDFFLERNYPGKITTKFTKSID